MSLIGKQMCLSLGNSSKVKVKKKKKELCSYNGVHKEQRLVHFNIGGCELQGHKSFIR